MSTNPTPVELKPCDTELRERVRDFIYDCTRDEFNIGWTLSAHQTDDLIAMTRQPASAAPGDELVERLRRTKTQVKVNPLFDGAAAYSDGEMREVLINPDGPEAADQLTIYARRVAEKDAALRSAHNTMVTVTDCIADGQPTRLEYAEQRLQREIEGIRTAADCSVVAAREQA